MLQASAAEGSPLVELLNDFIENVTTRFETLETTDAKLTAETERNRAEIKRVEGKIGLSECAIGNETFFYPNKKNRRLRETRTINFGRTFKRTPKVIASVSG